MTPEHQRSSDIQDDMAIPCGSSVQQSAEPDLPPSGSNLFSVESNPTSSRVREYKGFGSFMSDNVEDLVRVPTTDYKAPDQPAHVILHVQSSTRKLGPLKDMPFGRQSRKLFMLDFERWTFINHGAFGSPLKIAFKAAQKWREHCERQPLRFIDRELFPQTVHVLRKLSALIKCSPTDLVFVQNATQGLNAVINSVHLEPEDAVFMLSVGYGSVKKILKAACDQSGASLVTADVQFPLIDGHSSILDLVADSLPARAKLAVFDAVTSNTAVVLPIQHLVRLCHSRGVPVLIDGAHALGSMPIDLTALGADFFVGNCHKWFCNPKGCGFLWANPMYFAQYGGAVKPLVISHGSGSGFLSDFIWDGCRDYSAILALEVTMNMWLQVGVKRVDKYIKTTLAAACELLTAQWKTSTLVPLSMCANMALVEVPKMPWLHISSATSDSACTLQNMLYERRIECPVKCIDGTLYVRISVHIYNDLDDYKVLGDAIMDLKFHNLE
eukprot:CAMPEP_0114311158 /NCGR_PEP_ID=MMETSP0059-20121206/19663_1 /TAXON_ID=36894 /ORGANISM="Pyramimonas parkeae, Strain CCMP726" /LENGTH=496 /DNA_ID=CAMNT_0001435289 /DNA_START=134 /DNA_END=1624 /DNA_ORIENTATION=-